MLLVALVASDVAGCLGHGTFRCHDDQQCRAEGSTNGFCETTGSCSVLDATCPPSGRRYREHAEAVLADTCVQDACPTNPVVIVRAGGQHACVVRQRGQVDCWGAGTDGQLGDGTVISRSTIERVDGLDGASDVALGDRHTCALLATGGGSVWCWGSNESGQLGDGTQTSRTAPVAVAGLTGITQIVAGGAFTCALDTAGAVICWGRNTDGELGTNTGPKPILLPTAPVQIASVAALSARNRHACALTMDHHILCWGSNVQGELGDGTQIPRSLPTPVNDLMNHQWSAIAAGSAHTCAVDENAQMWCWGTNQLGELGDGTDEISLNPTAVPLSVTAITAGAHHTCGRESGGKVWCWGANQAGQLGEGTTTKINIPVPVAGIEDAVDMTAGDTFSCARRRDGSVWCWGDDRLGELGTGAAIERLVPARVSNLSGALSISAGNAHTCARRPATGGASATVCWGDNLAGEIGDGTRLDRATPVPLKISLDARDIATGSLHSCLRGGDGSIWCWGRGGSGQLGTAALIDFVAPIAVQGLTGTTGIAAGGAHTCALQQTAVLCWGANDEGQLGDGTMTGRSTPAAVLGIGDAVELALGGAHTCIRRSDGSVACWGRGDEGQLGNDDPTSSPSPVVVANLATAVGPNLANVISLTAGDGHTCAVLADGTATCWGAGSSGQLGWGSLAGHSIPVKVTNLGPAVEIVAGGRHTCARTSPDGRAESAGSVFCWGDNSTGQLGDGTHESRTLPTTSAVLTNVLAVAAGGAHTCALLADHSVTCWGLDSSGQLGEGATLQVPTAQPTRIACP